MTAQVADAAQVAGGVRERRQRRDRGGELADLGEVRVDAVGVRQQVPDSPELVRLTGIYHNLLRQWTQT